MEAQQFQIRKLKEITGMEFKFVSEAQSPHHVKAYFTRIESPEQAEQIIQNLGANGLSAVFDTRRQMIHIVQDDIDQTRLRNAISHDNPNVITEPIGHIHGHPVHLVALPARSGQTSIAEVASRAVAVVRVNGKNLPFYVSSGQSRKDDRYGIPAGQWYPLAGIGSVWLNKMPNMLKNPAAELDQIVQMLQERFPAAQMKEKALSYELPGINQIKIAAFSNLSFPEGVVDNLQSWGDSFRIPEKDTWLYNKNINVYLNDIISTWRMAPECHLAIYYGPLAVERDKIIRELQRQLPVRVAAHGDSVEFFTNPQYPTPTHVQKVLRHKGIFVNENLTAPLDTLLCPEPARKKTPKTSHPFTRKKIASATNKGNGDIPQIMQKFLGEKNY